MSRKICTDTCKFCRLLGRNSDSETSLHYYDRVLIETDNFVIIPTIGALLEGWLLIVSKEHYLCLGEMPSKVFSELKELKALTSELLEACYSKPTIFEHGPSRAGSLIGCGIDHAHLHLVPVNFKLSKKNFLNKSYKPVKWKETSDDFSALKNHFLSNTPYLYIEEPSGGCLISSAQDLPSQYFRRIIAYQIGAYSQFDYKQHTFEEKVRKTIRSLKPKFSDLKLRLKFSGDEVVDNVLKSA